MTSKSAALTKATQLLTTCWLMLIPFLSSDQWLLANSSQFLYQAWSNHFQDASTGLLGGPDKKGRKYTRKTLYLRGLLWENYVGGLLILWRALIYQGICKSCGTRKGDGEEETDQLIVNFIVSDTARCFFNKIWLIMCAVWKPLHLKGRSNLEKSRKPQLEDFLGGVTPLLIFILLKVQCLYVRNMQWHTEEYKMRYKVLWLYAILFMWPFLFSSYFPLKAISYFSFIHFLLWCSVFNVFCLVLFLFFFSFLMIFSLICVWFWVF